MFKFYEVGGKVRDEILGLQSKDVDYVAVPNEALLEKYSEAHEMFVVLESYLLNQGFQIFLSTPNCYTIRAKFPKEHKYEGVADFVMARKEIGYITGTRTPIIKPLFCFVFILRSSLSLFHIYFNMFTLFSAFSLIAQVFKNIMSADSCSFV